MAILDLHRNPGHATPWYLRLVNDHGQVTVTEVQHGDGPWSDWEDAVFPDYLAESFDFTNYESLGELAEMFEDGLPREEDGSVIMKVTEPQYR